MHAGNIQEHLGEATAAKEMSSKIEQMSTWGQLSSTSPALFASLSREKKVLQQDIDALRDRKKKVEQQAIEQMSTSSQMSSISLQLFASLSREKKVLQQDIDALRDR